MSEAVDTPTPATHPETGEELPSLHLGDHVEDRDDPDATMIVVATPPRPISKAPINQEQTVADVNPDADDNEPVIKVVFADRSDTDLRSLQRYGYPRSRLRRVESVHSEGDDE